MRMAKKSERLREDEIAMVHLRDCGYEEPNYFGTIGWIVQRGKLIYSGLKVQRVEPLPRKHPELDELPPGIKEGELNLETRSMQRALVECS